MARDALVAMQSISATGEPTAAALSLGDEAIRLPTQAVAALGAVLKLLAAGRTVIVSAEIAEAIDRPRCADCGEPVVLADAQDPETWIHALDANDQADHTAWVSE